MESYAAFKARNLRELAQTYGTKPKQVRQAIFRVKLQHYLVTQAPKYGSPEFLLPKQKPTLETATAVQPRPASRATNKHDVSKQTPQEWQLLAISREHHKQQRHAAAIRLQRRFRQYRQRKKAHLVLRAKQWVRSFAAVVTAKRAVL